MTASLTGWGYEGDRFFSVSSLLFLMMLYLIWHYSSTLWTTRGPHPLIPSQWQHFCQERGYEEDIHILVSSDLFCMILYLITHYFSIPSMSITDKRHALTHSITMATSLSVGEYEKDIHISVSSGLFWIILYLIRHYFSTPWTCQRDERHAHTRSITIIASLSGGGYEADIDFWLSSHLFLMILISHLTLF
jgi:hypothetical protein